MATGGLYGSTSTGTVAPQSGSESVGLYGNNTVFGGSYFEYLIFLDSAFTPATPTGGSWSFVTNTGTPPTGWSNNPPQTPAGKVWISIALVNSKSTATLTWSTPGIFASPAGTGTVISVAALTLTTAGTDVSSTVANPTISPVITLNLPTASATNRGALSAADWTTFNSKGSGTVTSVAATVPSFLSVAGSPITTSGTLALTYSGTALPVVNGGTGVTTSTGTGSNVLSTSPSLTTPTQVTYENWTPISEPAYTEGRVWYDSNAHALAYFNDAASSVAHVGHELQVKVINNTGSTIANGAPVYITGTSSGQTYPNIALAKADVAATASVLGLTNGAIANGAFGYVTSAGTIDDVNTGAFTVGQVLYLSPYSAGQLMNTLPPTGITVQVGVVEYVNSSTGKIYVKQTTPLSIPASILTGAVAVANGGTALTATPTNGQLLIGNGTGYSLSTVTAGTGISVTNASGSITIAATGSGTVTSVTGTSPVVSSGGTTPAISLAASYGDTQNPYASKTANYVLAAPNGSAGVPTFRSIVAADIPTLNQNTTGTAANITATSNSTLTTLSGLSLPYSQLSGVVPTWNQNTTGTASNVTGTVAIANGGTGATTAAAALTNLGAYPASNPSGYGTGTVTSVAASVPSFLSVSGSPVTTSGTLAISYSGTALPIANGGSGATTAQAAMNAFAGAVISGSYLRGNGTNVVMSTIQAADVPTLNQSTTGNAATATTATNIAGGTNLQIPYNTGSGATSFIVAPTISSTYLQYNGTGFAWASAAGLGTVTSVGQTFTGGLISVSGSPVTTAGTLALTVAGTSGGIPYFSSGTTWATSAALASNALMVGGGAGVAPSTVTTGTGVVTALGVNTGSAGAVVINGSALGTPSSGTLTNATGLPLTTGVTGILPPANGGTGIANNAASTLTISGSFGTTLTISGTTAVTLPTTGTLATLAGTETLTNKTLTNPTVTNYVESVVAIGNSSTAQTLLLTNGTVQTVTLTGNCTFTMPTATAGKSFILIISTGSGGFTATFTSVKWPSNTAPTITTTASRWDILTFVTDGTNWYGNSAQAYA